ncbi:unnamed protein product, partial [Porites evermanni]
MEMKRLQHTNLVSVVVVTWIFYAFLCQGQKIKISSFAFSTPTTASQSQSYAVSLSSILELRSPTSGALTTSQSSP